MMKLDEFIGENIYLKPKIAFQAGEEHKLYPVKLSGVELGGIWIESEALTLMLKKAVGLTAEQPTPKTPVFFFPYSEIYFFFVGSTQLGQEHVE